MEYQGLINRLKNLERVAYGYNINEQVLGMDCCVFGQIMADASKAIEEMSEYITYRDDAYELADEAFSKWKTRAEAAGARAEKAEREKNEAVEFICIRCSVLPCRKNECYWYRFKKEK